MAVVGGFNVVLLSTLHQAGLRWHYDTSQRHWSAQTLKISVIISSSSKVVMLDFHTTT